MGITFAWDADVSLGLDELIRSGGPGVAVFDADGTLWATDVVLTFLDHWGSQLPARHSPDFSATLERVRSEITPASAVLQLALFAGLSVQQATAWAQDTYARHVAPTVYEPIRVLMGKLESAGFETWVCSGSPHWLVEPCVEHLGITARRVIATRSIVHDGLLTADPLQVTAGPGKATAIQGQIGSRLWFAAGDSMSDFEMLKMADHALVMAPVDDDGRRGALPAQARAHHWWIQPIESQEALRGSRQP